MQEFISSAIVISIILLGAYVLRYKRLRALYRKEIGATSKGRGYIYVFRGRYEWFWWVKIGRAKDVYQRLSQHKTGASPFGVEVVAVIRVRDDVKAETLIHQRFDAEHIVTETNGSEWYWYSPRMLEYFLLVKDYSLTKQVKARY